MLQITQIKLLESSANGASGNRLCRVALSDSIHSISGIFGSDVNHLFETGQIDTMCVIQITGCIVVPCRERWLMKSVKINPVNTIRMVGKLGNPEEVETVVPVVNAEPGTKSPPPLAPHPTSQSFNPLPARPPYSSQQQQQPLPYSKSGFMPNNAANQASYGAPHNQHFPAQGNSIERRPVPTIPPPSTTHPQINSDEVMAFSSKQSNAKKPPPIRKMAQTMQSATTMPISALSPYTEGWTIRARCTQKGDIKTWTNAKGEGKVFSAVVIDGTGEIRITAFNDQVDQFYGVLQPGQTYAISSGQVRPSKRAFNTTKNDYEIHLTGHSQIEHDSSASASIPMSHYDFTTIKDISQLEKDTMIDVVAVVKEVGECSSITTRTKQQQLSKRELVIVDDSQCSIRLTLWAQRAEEYDTSMSNPVIVVKAAKVSDYQGKGDACME